LFTTAIDIISILVAAHFLRYLEKDCIATNVFLRRVYDFALDSA